MIRRTILALISLFPIPSARANFESVDFSESLNFDINVSNNSSAGFPRGSTVLGGVPFDLPVSGLNAWHSEVAPGGNPRILEVSVSVYGVSVVHTLINTAWGAFGPSSFAYVEFEADDGTVFRKDLVGHDDIRDFLDNGLFTSFINGTTTTEVLRIGGPPNAVYDKQAITLPVAFRQKVLRAIRFADNGGFNFQRIIVAGITAELDPKPAVFGIKSTAAMPSSAPTVLFRFTNEPNSVFEIGTITLGETAIDVDGLAVSPTFDPRAFRLEPTGSTLISIDPAGATATVRGNLMPGKDIRGAAFDPNENLWVIDAASGELLRVHAFTGEVLGPATALTLNAEQILALDESDLAFDTSGTLFLSLGEDVYTVDVATGGLQIVLSDSGQSLAGIALSFLAPDDLFACDVSDADDLVAYDLSGTFARADLVLDFLSSFNAGGGDLGAAIADTPFPVRAPDVVISLIENDVRLTWEAAPNHTYRVWSASSAIGPWSNLPLIGITQTGDEETATDVNAASEIHRFYIIEGTLGP